jgi:hypothetical protein
MLEPIMFLGIGFLAASLMMLALFPVIHERAVRLTTRRLTAATPLSVTEMQAEKDLLRAEFAMSIRRLEISAAETKAKAVDQLCEVGRKMAEVQGLRAELAKASALAEALQARERRHRSLTRRVAKLVLYLFARSRRDERVSLFPAAQGGDGSEDWQTILTRFRLSLQKTEMAHGGT